MIEALCERTKRTANDQETQRWNGFSAEIRIRAERRVGELVEAQKATVRLARPAVGSKVIGSKRVPIKDTRPSLSDAGIDKKLSSRAQQLAAGCDEVSQKVGVESFMRGSE